MATGIGVNKTNVGRIAERIVSNELEYHGFRVSDLNKESTSANADLLAVKDGKPWQIQVKGSTDDDGTWFGYGYCTDEIIKGPDTMFNRTKSFYKAEIVVLVSVKTPKEYSCVVLPVTIAEEAAQINLAREFRTTRKDGQPEEARQGMDGVLYAAEVNRRRQKGFRDQRTGPSQAVP